MYRTPKVFIVSQPFFPVPPVLDGAISHLIQDTIDCLDTTNNSMKVISTWDKQMNSLSFNKGNFYFVYRKSPFLRIIKKIFIRKINPRLAYEIKNTSYLDMLYTLFVYSILDRPQMLVVHTTRCEWVINIRKVFPKNTIKVVWYHHMSEDHVADDAHLKNFSLVDAHIFVSNHAREKFVAHVRRFDKLIEKKSYVIPNGINTEIFAFNAQTRRETRQTLGVSDGTTLILYAGRLIPRKGLHKLLDAYSLLPKDIRDKTVLYLAGAEDYYRSNQSDYIFDLKEKAKDIGARIIFGGYIPRKVITGLYCSADFFVLPSIEEEGMPVSIIEAQSVGLPVIASNMGGIPEIIINNETGFIYEHDAEPAKLAEYMKLLIEDPLLRSQFGQKAKNNTMMNFPRERMAKDFSRIVSKVLYDSQ